MHKQMSFNYQDTPKTEERDEFTKDTRPLEELLDSVRDVDGFPIATDEDILALSDPPYYTACPNPYINDFIAAYGKPYDPDTDDYERTPFLGDVSEGKNDPIYNAHSYHTKVPHKAIMKYIEHYTEEGDIVFDGFCGTGMTGVAAQLLNRRAVLADLSPAATFIAYNYNTPVDVEAFESEAKRIFQEVEDECGWMYETLHTDGRTKGRINYTVWSDVFTCPYCLNDYVFMDAAVDKAKGKVNKEYACPECRAGLKKQDCERATVTFFDALIGQEVTQAKQVPVLINYSLGKKRFEKTPDEADLRLIREIEDSAIPYWVPTDAMMNEGERWGDTWRAGYHFGITHVHHFYTKRNLWVLGAIRNRCSTRVERLWFNSQLINISKLNRYRPGVSFPYNPLSGTLYIASQVSEANILIAYYNKLKRLKKAFKNVQYSNVIGTSSVAAMGMDSSIDYIFTDPPFGDNLMYSELNFLWEAWLRVFTNNGPEAVVNKSQVKSLNEYKELMISCFQEMYRILKPNRWITVEFHNSKASVWNAIQDAMTKAGFVIAQVAVLDKKQGSFKQVTSAGAVKNDLVINAYKPRQKFEEHFLKNAGEGLEREFVAEHLRHLPIEPNIERTEQMLYSKMLAHYVQRGYAIRLNARRFYKMLRDNFKIMDGYWFDEDQVMGYEKWKRKAGLEEIKEIKSGQQILFIKDEKSALAWLYDFLKSPQTYSDILTAHNKVVTSVDDAVPELRELLDNNFIFEEGKYRRPETDQEKEEIERHREKTLQREFERVLAEAKSGIKRLKNVRKEAVKHGFTLAYQEKRFGDILSVSAKLDKKILEENSELNDFVEIARIKGG